MYVSEKKTNFNTNDQAKFIHNTNLVSIIAAGASLKKRSLASGEIYMANGRVTKDADLSSGATQTSLVGNASWSKNDKFDLTDDSGIGYLSLNNDDARDGITILPNRSCFNFGPSGRIQWKMSVPYNGNPAKINHILTTGNSTVSTGLGSMIYLKHETDGRLVLGSKNNAGQTSGGEVAVAWTPETDIFYEFELKVDQTGKGIALYINDIKAGATQLSSAPTTDRDYFYFGNFFERNVAYTSSLTVCDIQIFNTVGDIDQPSNHLPRVANIYPLEAKIVPTEHTIVEGVDLFDAELTGDTKFLIQLDFDQFYISNGTLVPSDGSHSQANSKQEIIDELEVLNSNVETGKEIVFIPVLSSGEFGLEPASIVSLSMNYNFFARISPLNSCLVYGYVNANDDEIESGTVTISTSAPFVAQGRVHSVKKTYNIRPVNGYFDFPVVVPDKPTEFDLKIQWKVKGSDKNWKIDEKIFVKNESSTNYLDILEAWTV